ncbi:suppressor of fused domain protein [Pseudomonas sp. DOAB1069]|uniref:Suppressor of fused domain protein n=1 Tax=Pseudomonas folii TaxID=2762593 RepID=A0ABR7B060_9PSED|nr:suppressor of fused domain protein [Pseudomonas folii]
MENAVDEYCPRTKMPHLYLCVPFLWNDGHFEELIFDEVKINWLQCFATYDIEKKFIDKNGSDAFEDLMSIQETDVFDMERQPVRLPYQVCTRSWCG